MKDLYTFDSNLQSALETYEVVRQAYSAFFNELKIPYLVAKADSGNIGGELSHEYHFPTTKGEDVLVSCNTCDYVANEELAECDHGREDLIRPGYQDARLSSVKDNGQEAEELVEFAKDPSNPAKSYRQWFGITHDRRTLVQAIIPAKKCVVAAEGDRLLETQVSPYAIKKIFPDLDLGAENPVQLFHEQNRENLGDLHQQDEVKLQTLSRIFRLYDNRIASPSQYHPELEQDLMVSEKERPRSVTEIDPGRGTDLVRIANGDKCVKCTNGRLKLQSAVELGHTFHLGTKYSKPLDALIAADPAQISEDATCGTAGTATQAERVFLQMGCHGIGVSRMIGAVADSLADVKGLNWPRVMAPFECVIVPTKGTESEVVQVYQLLCGITPDSKNELVDAIIDDRSKDFGWKLKDADMIGYPVIVILGRGWKDGSRTCEVQCRRLGGLKTNVPAEELHTFVVSLLEQM